MLIENSWAYGCRKLVKVGTHQRCWPSGIQTLSMQFRRKCFRFLPSVFVCAVVEKRNIKCLAKLDNVLFDKGYLCYKNCFRCSAYLLLILASYIAMTSKTLPTSSLGSIKVKSIPDGGLYPPVDCGWVMLVTWCSTLVAELISSWHI